MRSKHRIGARLGLLLGLAGLSTGTGCIHNHYYTPGTVPVTTIPGTTIGNCDPVVSAPVVSSTQATPALGAVCETSPPAAPVASRGVRSTPIVTNAAPPEGRQIFFSQPMGAPRRNGIAWRGLPPESQVITRTDGGYNGGETQTR